jgi:hypothetical protein
VSRGTRGVCIARFDQVPPSSFHASCSTGHQLDRASFPRDAIVIIMSELAQLQLETFISKGVPSAVLISTVANITDYHDDRLQIDHRSITQYWSWLKDPSDDPYQMLGVPWDMMSAPAVHQHRLIQLPPIRVPARISTSPMICGRHRGSHKLLERRLWCMWGQCASWSDNGHRSLTGAAHAPCEI